jgi:hypothetical protein
MVLPMKIIVQQKEVNKHTNEVIREEVSLDNDDYDGYNFVRVVIGGQVVAELPVADLYTAVEAFQRHIVRHDEEQVRMVAIEKGQ